MDVWEYPYPPWDFPGEVWTFFGIRNNATHPPDFVPDPAISYSTGAVLSAITIFRFPDIAWGPWDAILFLEYFARVGNGPMSSRSTQAFSSAVPPTQPSYPFHVPYRLAKFAWTTRADGSQDLQVFSPPTSTSPVVSITRLFALPFLCLPLPRGFFPALGLTNILQSVTDSYDPVGPITGHTLGNVDASGCLTAAVYASIKVAPPVILDGVTFNLGFHINGTVDFSLLSLP
eukprot:jgi/Botrbrau1/14601/Bobra.67_2s0001.1